jgi:hypothetical protein
MKDARTTALVRGSVGILPAGALGVGFFHHLTELSGRLDGSVVFLDRPGSSSSRAMHAAGGLRLRTGDGAERRLEGRTVLGGNLVDRLVLGAVPDVVIVTCNPDQLLEFVTHFVEFVCEGHARFGLERADAWLPAVLLAPNGIYFQRLRLVCGEKLEEAAVFGRLPPLWPDHLEMLLGRLLRGVTMQTGVREGSGGDAVYRPGPAGHTKVGGGDANVRRRIVAVLAGRGASIEDAGPARPTRLEFDKALINLVSNLLGQLLAVDARGAFAPLEVEEILARASDGRSLELARHLFAVGRAVGAYGKEESPEGIHETMTAASLVNRRHVPSSLQYLGLALRAGTLRPRLTPTEQWLIEPLVRYARSAGLDDAVAYFRGLRERLQERLRLAIAHAAAHGATRLPVAPEDGADHAVRFPSPPNP